MKRAILLLTCLVGCMTGEDLPGDPSDYDAVTWTSSDGKADFAGVPATFDRHNIMSDEVMFTADAIDAAALQEFFEHPPYDAPSWLADYTIGGKKFSVVLAEEAKAGGIDPVVLLARMQVESSLVSRTTKPGPTTLNHALGCGCPDSAACSSAYAGMVNQLRCAATVLNDRYSESLAGNAEWQKDKTKRTLDPLSVTPRTHATAALYAYTPWVLQGRGGNWLVWNVTRKYLKHFDDAGTLHLP